ncbi:hypothetical protein MBLNU459_g4822t1 [Dothideomycetes sp. NU459]
MASTPAPPKSILKKTVHNNVPFPSTPGLPTPKSDVERRRLDTAIQHARLIQDQKDVLARNLNAIEELSELPASSTATAAEVVRFTSLVMAFQPSDYDALVEERHANGLCGYALCANPPRKTDARRPWLRPKGSENWCSDDCARRALYVKAQLDETPAWERRGGGVASITLYDDRKYRAANGGDAAAATAESRANERNLALERGEKVAAFKIDGVMSTQIMEKKPAAAAMPPTMTTYAGSHVHDLIEGYQPKSSMKNGGVKFEDEDDSA